MIDRVTSSVDLYSHLRVDVYLQSRQTRRLPPPSQEAAGAGSGQTRPGTMLDLDVDDRSRRPQWEEDAGGNVVPFEQTTSAIDSQSDPGYGGRADEVPLVLEMSSAQRNPLLAQVALLYARTGHPVTGPGAGAVGTRLNVIV